RRRRRLGHPRGPPRRDAEHRPPQRRLRHRRAPSGRRVPRLCRGRRPAPKPRRTRLRRLSPPVAGLVLVVSAGLTSLLSAACPRLRSPVTTLLAGYVALVANLALVTLVLSPFHELTRGGLAVAEGALLVAVSAVWWRLGRPRPAVQLPALGGTALVFLVAIA